MKTRYLEIDDRTEDLKDLLRQNKARAKEFEARFEASLIHHENALEGVVYTGAELMAALDPNSVAMEASTAGMYAVIRNHKAALDFVRSEAKAKKLAINMTLVKKLFEMLGAGIDGKDKAVFRKDIPLHRSYFHEIAPPAKIQPALEQLFATTTSADFKELHPINQAAQVHWSFMQAFPFTDNSGKVARLLANLILVRAGYLPLIIHAVDRQRYYESLRVPPGALRSLMVEAMINSLDNAFLYMDDGRQSIVSRAS